MGQTEQTERIQRTEMTKSNEANRSESSESEPNPTTEEQAFVFAAARFRSGRHYITPGANTALEALPAGIVAAADLIARHMAGDWGDDMDEEDKAANDCAVKNGGRILSAYILSDGTRIWIITEADRSTTTLLLPEEY